MSSTPAIQMRSQGDLPASLGEALHSAAKALAPPILGVCLAVGMPLTAPAELSPEQKLVPSRHAVLWRACAWLARLVSGRIPPPPGCALPL